MDLKDFSNKLNQIGKNAQKTNYSAEELLTNDFFRKNTNIFYKTFFSSFFINKCYNKRELREDKKNGKNYCSECW